MRIYCGLGKFSAGDKEVLVFLAFKSITMELQIIRYKIYEIRGQKVMLDFDLAELYGVETKVFNQAVKRNSARFPGDFMFQLTTEEWERWSQIVTTSEEKSTQKTQEVDNQSGMGKIRRSQIASLLSGVLIKIIEIQKKVIFTLCFYGAWGVNAGECVAE